MDQQRKGIDSTKPKAKPKSTKPCKFLDPHLMIGAFVAASLGEEEQLEPRVILLSFIPTI
jgi:hypothetical protein